MKRMTVLAFLAATLVPMTGARAHAQISLPVEAKVPFNFVVQDRAFPAGTYRITYYAPKGVILIQNRDGNVAGMSTTYAADGLPRGQGMLVFRKYGEQYFLHDVLCSEADMNVTVPTSKLEKRARVQEGHLASPQTQIVALLRGGAK